VTMTEEYVEVTATVTDRWSGVETVYAGTQPLWAWKIDRCAAWRKMMRRSILEDRTADPRGWRVTFDAEVLTDD